MLPNKLIELTLADGKEIDLPGTSIVMMEEMLKDTNANFPEARIFAHYVIGSELKTVILSTKFEDLIFELGLNATPGEWLKLTLKDGGRRFYVLGSNIVAREATDDSCIISVVVGQSVQKYEVNETRRQIKKWSERELGRPEGLVEIEVPKE